MMHERVYCRSDRRSAASLANLERHARPHRDPPRNASAKVFCSVGSWCPSVAHRHTKNPALTTIKASAFRVHKSGITGELAQPGRCDQRVRLIDRPASNATLALAIIKAESHIQRIIVRCQQIKTSRPDNARFAVEERWIDFHDRGFRFLNRIER